jgi:ABC-type nitrate/sulfonate/bicarbonate transport system ATPase subunit
VVLMDEPFAALDAFNRTALQDELLRLREKTHIAVLLITHDLAEALILGQRVVVMTSRPGRVLRIYAVDFPEPRSAVTTRGSREFLELFQELWQILMRESGQGR